MTQDKESTLSLKLTRGMRKRARTRADLLASARRVFAERGYHDATVADITEAADVGVGTFYLHFHDKDAILSTLIEEGLAAIRQQVIAEVQRQGDASLPIVMRAVLHHAYEQRDLFRIALMEGGPVMRRFRVREGLLDTFTVLIEETPELLQLTEEEIALLAQFITGITVYAIQWWFAQDEPMPDVMAQRVLSLLEHGLPPTLFIKRPL